MAAQDRRHVGIVNITASEPWTPPQWALMERQLFDILNRASSEFVDRYTLPDGTLIWRESWPGMDGSDDPYEAFMNLALLYVLGGSDKTYELACKMWEAITWQWSEYGQIHREFDAYYDWMHHGEGYLYLYFLGLASPYNLRDRQRAQRFAAMYTGHDSEAENYDKAKKLIRSPINGSRGPQFHLTEEDWITHRGILDDYLPPFEDLPGVDIEQGKCPWSNDDTYKEIILRMNERMAKGDVPLNLNATGLISHAYMYTGDESYRQWVLGYLEAWEERTLRNNGIIPDNIGLSGQIGEYNEGKWWGGYYGWRWPHGFMTIIEPLINASMNAVLLGQDMKWLGLLRSQLDINWSLGKEMEGKWVVPHRHFDKGWNDYRHPNPLYPIYLWTVSMAEEDLQRVKRIPSNSLFDQVIIPKTSGGDPDTGQGTKHFLANTVQWFNYMQGENPAYPEQILNANYKMISNQLEKMRSDLGDPLKWDHLAWNIDAVSSIHRWQEMCPIYFEALLQLTLGGPAHLSHGGLQHGRFRYFDAANQRPGLPDSVAALVEELSADSAILNLVNTSLFEDREVIIQVGTFGEHQLIKAQVQSSSGEIIQSEIKVDSKWLCIKLLKGTGIKLKLQIERYVNLPTYETPFYQDLNHSTKIVGRH